MYSLELENLTKKYGDVLAVDSVNFSCKQGEFIALLGPSGCGKSSTMRMIAGLEEISDGEIRFNGKRMNELEPRDRNVALAFESYALYSPLTVYENLELPLRGKIEKNEIKKKIIEMAERFELTELLYRKPRNLSGGQSQRVSLARAIIREPDILLLDEPLSHLDQRLRSIIRARIRNTHDNLKNTTTIYVTHDQDEAVALADRIIVMNDKNFQQIGTVEELWDKPTNMFVGGFLGDPSMNFFEISAKNGELHFPNGSKLKLEINKNNNRNVVIGVRPDWFIVNQTNQKKPHISGEIKVIEFQGDQNILTVNTELGTLKLITDTEKDFLNGSKIGLNFNPKKVSLFDIQSKKAISL